MGYLYFPDVFFRINILEFAYWRGVSNRSWWNNHAEELYDYIWEYFPWNKVKDVRLLNTNSKDKDYNNPAFHNRLNFLRDKKLDKIPLIVLNYDEAIIHIKTMYDREMMMDWVDFEWYRWNRQLNPARRWRGISKNLQKQIDIFEEPYKLREQKEQEEQERINKKIIQFPGSVGKNKKAA